MRDARQPVRLRSAAPIIAMLVAAALVGCSKKPERRTVMEIKRDYAQRLVEGMTFADSGRIKAASFDDRTFTLRTLTIDTDTQVMTAKSAEIIVDPSTDTLRLRLHDVTGASTETPGIAESGEMTTSEIKLGFDAVP